MKPYKYEIAHPGTPSCLTKAKAKCVKQRCVVSPESARILRYYDKRDIPGFKEETNEEAEERRAKEKKNSLFESTKKRMHLENMQAAIVKKLLELRQQGRQNRHAHALCGRKQLRLPMSKEGRKFIHIDDEKGRMGMKKYIEDMPDEMTATDVGKANPEEHQGNCQHDVLRHGQHGQGIPCHHRKKSR